MIFLIFLFFSTGMHHMQPHAAPAPPMPQMEMDEPPNKKARGKLISLKSYLLLSISFKRRMLFCLDKVNSQSNVIGSKYLHT